MTGLTADLVAKLIVKNEAAYEQSLAEYRAYHAARLTHAVRALTRESGE